LEIENLQQQGAKAGNDFETARLGVFATPGSPLARARYSLNCGIRVQSSFQATPDHCRGSATWNLGISKILDAGWNLS
jgi:hypothetical protein